MKKGPELLSSGDPELIAKLAKAMTRDVERIEIRTNIKDEAGEFIDSFVSDVVPVVGDFIDLSIHGTWRSYKVVERRLSLQHFTDKATNVPTHIRNLEITARLLPE